MARKNKKAKKRKSNFIYYLIIVILLLFIGAVVVYGKLGYSREKADLNDYFSITADDQAGVVIDKAVMGAKGIVIKGVPYVEYETVSDYISSRFYIDKEQKVLLYALPDYLIKIKSDKTDYNNGTKKVSCDHAIWTLDGSKAYISLDFLEKYSAITGTFKKDPNRIMILTEFGKVQTTTVKSKTQVRKLAGVKSPILTELKKGDKLTWFDTVDDWYHVRTEDGFIGYVPKKYLSKLKTEKISCEYVEPEYSHLLEQNKICLAFVNVTNTVANDSLKSRVGSADGITVLAPTWFSVKNVNGDLESIATKSYVTEAHKMNMRVWATVRDFDSEQGINSSDETYTLLSNTKAREKMVSQLMKEAKSYDLDGINVDFEKISDECGISYVQFIRELSIKCRAAGIILSVDNYVPKAYNSHYGRKEQGLFADYIVIMGYDEHTYGSDEAGSVASYDFVEEGIERTIEDVSEERVINAIPFYTRLWIQDGKKLTFKSYNMQDAAAVVKKAGVKAKWDDETHQDYAEWESNGKSYKIWLENAASIKDKLSLMNEYELAGVGVWRLGQETSNVWPLIKNYLKE